MLDDYSAVDLLLLLVLIASLVVIQPVVKREQRAWERDQQSKETVERKGRN
jgi:hypothetical protein